MIAIWIFLLALFQTAVQAQTVDCQSQGALFVGATLQQCYASELRQFIDRVVENRFSTCRGPFVWNITLVDPTDSIFIEEVYLAEYEDCETFVKFYASIRGPLLSSNNDAFAIRAPLGRVGPNGQLGNAPNEIVVGDGEAISVDRSLKARTTVSYLQSCAVAGEPSLFSDRLFFEIRDNGSVGVSYNYNIKGRYALTTEVC